MHTFYALFLIILTGLFSSTVLRKFHFPWVISLIIGGIIIGPQGLHLFQSDATTEFIGQLGLTFLMFMAGLETKLTSFNESSKELFILSFLNGFIPFIVGMAIGYFLGYGFLTMFMIGVVFVSSSIAVIIPTLEHNNLLESKIGKSVMTTIIMQDIVSLLLLSVLLQNVAPVSKLPLYIFYPLLICAVVLLRYLIPIIRNYLAKMKEKEDFYQDELHSVFVILLGTIVVFEILGLHSIIGGFFAGLVLSESVKDNVLLGKLRAIGYGIFIPTFFIIIGTETNVHVFLGTEGRRLVILLVVLGSILSKFISGTLAAKLVGFNRAQSLFFGISSIPQLSTTLATAYAATKLGILTHELNTAFVVLSITSTLVGPLLLSKINNDSIRQI